MLLLKVKTLLESIGPVESNLTYPWPLNAALSIKELVPPILRLLKPAGPPWADACIGYSPINSFIIVLTTFSIVKLVEFPIIVDAGNSICFLICNPLVFIFMPPFFILVIETALDVPVDVFLFFIKRIVGGPINTPSALGPGKSPLLGAGNLTPDNTAASLLGMSSFDPIIFTTLVLFRLINSQLKLFWDTDPLNKVTSPSLTEKSKKSS